MASNLAGTSVMKQRSLHWLDTALAKVTHREAMAEAERSGVVFEATEAVGYSKQADADVNTLEAFMKRRKIRRHPIVVKALNQWWAMALEYAQMARPGCSDLTFEDYRDIHRLLYEELVGEDEYDDEEADEAAKEEWDAEIAKSRSSGGGVGALGYGMGMARFTDGMVRFLPSRTHPSAARSAMLIAAVASVPSPTLSRSRARTQFELVDLYVPSLSADDYSEFLSDLQAC